MVCCPLEPHQCFKYRCRDHKNAAIVDGKMKPCSRGLLCARPRCRSRHDMADPSSAPSIAPAPTQPTSKPQVTSKQKRSPTKPTSKKKQNCPLTESTCRKFQCEDHPQTRHDHPKNVACKSGASCSRSGCQYSHARPCPLNRSECAKYRCPDHPNNRSQSSHPQFCSYGTGCSKSNCKYSHQMPSSTSPSAKSAANLPGAKDSHRAACKDAPKKKGKGGGLQRRTNRPVKVYSEEEATLREATAILNKMVPESMDKLTVQLQALHLSDASLQVITEKLFEKALLEPKYCKMYAQLCKALTDTGDAEQGALFRRRLLGLCEKAFLGRADLVLAADPESQLEQERLSRMRMCGNMEFVGELYQQQLIAEKVVTICFDKLLQKVDCINMECFCKLMTNVGKQLSAKPKNKTTMDAYFARLTQESRNDSELDHRTRFMILDLLELHRNDWLPRSQKQQAKTIHEIHLDAEKEKEKTKSAKRNRGANPKQKDGRRRRNPPARTRLPTRGQRKKVATPTHDVGSTASSPNTSTLPEPVQPEPVSVKDPQTIRNNIEVTLEEFFDSGDLEEAVGCVEEFIVGAPELQVDFITTSFGYCFDKNKGYELLNALLRQLAQEQLIRSPNMTAGLREMICNLDEAAEINPLAPMTVGKAIVALSGCMEGGIQAIAPSLHDIEPINAARVVSELVKDKPSDLPLLKLTDEQLFQLHLYTLKSKLNSDDLPSICSWASAHIGETERGRPAFAREVFSHMARQLVSRTTELVEAEAPLFDRYRPLLELFVTSQQSKTEMKKLIQRQRDPLQSRMETYFASLLC